MTTAIILAGIILVMVFALLTVNLTRRKAKIITDELGLPPFDAMSDGALLKLAREMQASLVCYRSAVRDQIQDEQARLKYTTFFQKEAGGDQSA